MLKVVYEGFDGVLIFRGVIWTPLGKDGVFDINDVVIETRLLGGVKVLVTLPGSALDGAGSSLLLHFFLNPW